MTVALVKGLALDVLNTYDFSVDTPKIALFQNNYTPSYDTAIGDLVEASFGGYLAAALSGHTAAVRNPQGLFEVIWDGHAFIADGTISGPQTIYGWYIFNTDHLMMAERFDTPVIVAAEFDAILVHPRFGFSDAIGTGADPL